MFYVSKKVQVTVTTFIVRTSKTTAHHNENIQDKASLAGYTIVSGKFKHFFIYGWPHYKT